MIDRETIKKVALDSGMGECIDECWMERDDWAPLAEKFAERLFAEWSKGAEPVAPRFVPDSECAQGRCGNTTTGCVGTCKLAEALSPVAVIGPAYQLLWVDFRSDTVPPVWTQLYARPQPAIPPVLFDGYAVYQALGNAQAKTSPKNVSDVLDAVVRLIRAEAPEATK